MNLLQISRGDLLGSRFNGLSIKDLLRSEGVQSQYLAYNRQSADPDVGVAFPFPGGRTMTRGIAKIEAGLSTHSMLHFQSFLLPAHASFRRADVVHYHIIHDGYFSLLALPVLSRLKPSVWTWHDPWIMTGHCIYPMECTRWNNGCGSCPDLNRVFAMKSDKTKSNFALKKWLTQSSKIDVVLASRWMLDMAQRSPMSDGLRLHHIPFGLDLELYRPLDVDVCKSQLGVFKGRVTICVRAFAGPYKGLSHFIKALELLDTKVPVTIITFQDKGMFDHLIGKFQIIELGWISEDETMVRTYGAADIFAMPSTAEAFGLMAIEAMACGRPTVVFEGTSLPEVTFAPDAGLSVPMNNVEALASALKMLVEDANQRVERGLRSRKLAEQNYDARLYAKRLADLYKYLHKQGKSVQTGAQ